MVAINQISKKLTLEAFLKLPETKPAREYVQGKIEPKLMPQGEHSTLQIRLGTAINEVVLPKKIAHAFTELRCTFGGYSIVPDIAVFSWNRIPRTEKGRIANKFEVYPDWVIEILSPEQSANRVIKKILFCLQQGTELGWLIDPEDESVVIFQQNQLPDIKSDQEILPVLESIQDWQLSVVELFSWLKIDV
ncbi:MAG: Uma2 family endonuclease [Crocosphaera sp.]|nr:Uma2 family endonuclease [Crocosphaera sp.]